METFLIKALQLILSLSILVLVHEFGHYLFARLFKVRVDKFYLFFDPWFSLFRFKPKGSDTEYGIGWLPLGGYCKIAGMIDESMDKEQMAQPAQPDEFRSKSAGKRLMIMTAGVLFNFFLALFIYSMVLYTWGETYIPLKNMTHGMYYSQTFKNIGFQDGDILLTADGQPLERFGEETFRQVSSARTVTVLRDNAPIAIAIPDDVMKQVLRDKQGFADPNRIPMIVKEVSGGDSPAAQAGLQPNDSIVSINQQPTPFVDNVIEALSRHKNTGIEVGFYRNGQHQTVSLHTDMEGKMGIYPKTTADIYPTVTRSYGFFRSFPAGIMLGIQTLKGYVSDMKYVFTKEGAGSLGGFGTLGGLFPSQWHWPTFWGRTAFLSIILAFMNILPIPALDGGHVMFLLYEVIVRRKPGDKFLEYAQMTGMALLFALLLYANGNDLFRFFLR